MSFNEPFEKAVSSFNRASKRMDEVNKYWPSGWRIFFKRRCTARLEPNETGFFGRCDFMKHPRDVDHYLERGLMEVRFKTKITGV